MRALSGTALRRPPGRHGERRSAQERRQFPCWWLLRPPEVLLLVHEFSCRRRWVLEVEKTSAGRPFHHVGVREVLVLTVVRLLGNEEGHGEGDVYPAEQLWVVRPMAMPLLGRPRRAAVHRPHLSCLPLRIVVVPKCRHRQPSGGTCDSCEGVAPVVRMHEHTSGCRWVQGLQRQCTITADERRQRSALLPCCARRVAQPSLITVLDLENPWWGPVDVTGDGAAEAPSNLVRQPPRYGPHGPDSGSLAGRTLLQPSELESMSWRCTVRPGADPGRFSSTARA